MTHSEPTTRSPSSLSLTRGRHGWRDVAAPCDDEFIGTEERIGFLRSVFVDCVSQNSHTLLAALDAEIFPGPRLCPAEECRNPCGGDVLATHREAECV